MIHIIPSKSCHHSQLLLSFLTIRLALASDSSLSTLLVGTSLLFSNNHNPETSVHSNPTSYACGRRSGLGQLRPPRSLMAITLAALRGARMISTLQAFPNCTRVPLGLSAMTDLEETQPPHFTT